MFKKITLAGLILSVSVSSMAKSVHFLEISPDSLSPGQIQHRGPHQVAWSDENPLGLLLVTLGGTNSLPQDMGAISGTANQMGYQTIGLDYNNSIISTTCASSPDPKCFDLFRRTVTQGVKGSALLDVDKENSLETRLKTVLQKLVKENPATWSSFFDSSTEKVKWDRIVVIGHSQGSGHAAFLAKKHRLKSVILLAGPQDRFSNANTPASWLKSKGLTAPKSYLALLHQKDFFGAALQLQAVLTLRGESPKSSVPVLGLQPPARQGQPILVSNAPVQDGHMSVIQKGFEPLWRYLLSQAAK